MIWLLVRKLNLQVVFKLTLIASLLLFLSLADKPVNTTFLNLSNINPHSKNAIIIVGNRLIDYHYGFILFHTVREQQTDCDLIFLHFYSPSLRQNHFENKWLPKYAAMNVTIMNLSSPIESSDLSISYAKIIDNKAYYFIKLLLWQFIMYEKVMVLDADMLVLKNINHMFRFDAVLNLNTVVLFIASHSLPGHSSLPLSAYLFTLIEVTLDA